MPANSVKPKKSSEKLPQARSRLGSTEPTGRVDVSPQLPGDSPQLPHERDESVGMTGGVPSQKIQQAHADVTRGLQATDRGPEADEAYQKLKR